MAGINNEKKINTENEVDLIDLIRILYQRRKFILIFIIITTITGLLFLTLKEYSTYNNKKKDLINMTSGPDKSIYKLQIKNDPIMYSFDFLRSSIFISGLKKGSYITNYSSFLDLLLFGYDNENKPHYIINIGEKHTTNITLYRQEDTNNFFYKFNEFVGLLKGLKNSTIELEKRNLLTCYLIYLNSKEYVASGELRPKCNNTNYYLKILEEKILFAFAISNNNIYIPLSYIDSIIQTIDGYEGVIAESQKINTKQTLQDTNSFISFNIKKVIKHSVIIFVLSVILGIFIAIILEFWDKNKNNILKLKS